VLALLGYYHYSTILGLLSFGTVPGSVDNKVVHSLYTSGEVWLFIAYPICSILAVGVLLKTIQEI
jgi:hypothetical protein